MSRLDGTMVSMATWNESVQQKGILRSLFDIRPGEWRIAALMCLYFFLVITSFWILKPIKKTLFIGYYAASGFDLLGVMFSAAKAELLAKVLNIVVAAIAVVVFSMLARKLRRQQLTYVFTAFFMASYAVYAVVLDRPSGPGVWSFYLFGDLFSTLMVATFFAFLNDSMTSDAAKRLYGIVGFGGVAGGVFGSSAVAVWVGSLPVSIWLAVAAGIGLIIILVAWAAARSLPEETTEAGSVPGPGSEEMQHRARSDESSRRDAALSGARLVFRSSYLLSIVAIVGFYELVSTVVDFQFTSSMVAFSANEVALSQNIASVFATSNWLAMFVQLFLTSLVMRRFGLSTALLVLPVAIGLASTGFVLLPSLWTAGFLSIADNGFSYSINQSSKEALYVPTSVEEKYQAKAFIDMFVQRFAKALGVGLSLIVAFLLEDIGGVRFLSFLLLPVLAVWVYASIQAGRRFEDFDKEIASR